MFSACSDLITILFFICCLFEPQPLHLSQNSNWPPQQHDILTSGVLYGLFAALKQTEHKITGCWRNIQKHSTLGAGTRCTWSAVHSGRLCLLWNRPPSGWTTQAVRTSWELSGLQGLAGLYGHYADWATDSAPPHCTLRHASGWTLQHAHRTANVASIGETWQSLSAVSPLCRCDWASGTSDVSTYCNVHFQGHQSNNMSAIVSFETSGTARPTTQRNIPEDSHVQTISRRRKQEGTQNVGM